MEIALLSAKQVFIMLMLAGAGMICFKMKWIDNEGSRQLSSLLLQLVNPLIIIVSYQKEFEVEKLMGLGIALGLSVLSYILTIALSQLLLRNKPKELNFAVIFSNSSFFSIPVVLAILGTEAVFYLSAYLICFNVLTWTYGVILMGAGQVKMSLKKAIVNPGVIGVSLGLLLFVSPIKLPEVLFVAMQNIANLNTPLAMIVFGIFLAQIPFSSMVYDKEVWLTSLLRLLVIPGAIALLFMLVPQEYEVIKLTILVASSAPVAIVTVLFARQFEKDYIFATKAVGQSTILSIVCIPAVILFAQLIW